MARKWQLITIFFLCSGCDFALAGAPNFCGENEDSNKQTSYVDEKCQAHGQPDYTGNTNQPGACATDSINASIQLDDAVLAEINKCNNLLGEVQEKCEKNISVCRTKRCPSLTKMQSTKFDLVKRISLNKSNLESQKLSNRDSINKGVIHLRDSKCKIDPSLKSKLDGKGISTDGVISGSQTDATDPAAGTPGGATTGAAATPASAGAKGPTAGSDASGGGTQPPSTDDEKPAQPQQAAVPATTPADGAEPGKPGKSGGGMCSGTMGTIGCVAAGLGAGAGIYMLAKPKKKKEAPPSCGSFKAIKDLECQDKYQKECTSLAVDYPDPKGERKTAGESRTYCRAWAEDVYCNGGVSAPVKAAKHQSAQPIDTGATNGLLSGTTTSNANSGTTLCLALSRAQLCEAASTATNQCPTCKMVNAQTQTNMGAKEQSTVMSPAAITQGCGENKACMDRDPACANLKNSIGVVNVPLPGATGALGKAPAPSGLPGVGKTPRAPTYVPGQ